MDPSLELGVTALEVPLYEDLSQDNGASPQYLSSGFPLDVVAYFLHLHATLLFYFKCVHMHIWSCTFSHVRIEMLVNVDQ